MPFMSRRNFLKASALTLGAVAVSTGLAGCNLTGDSDNTDEDRAISFSHGIASGDPLQDAVIIWTRAVPGTDLAKPVTVRWEVATDAEFTNLTHNGEIQASSDHDFTVKVDVRNLAPGQTYHYRFLAGNETSAAGRTRTLPEGVVSTVKLAVMSCSNYPAGLFHVYREVARIEDLNAVVHLGDYIYEYDGDGYATEDAEALGRTLHPENDVEIVDLVDYRRRYALYRTDPDLQGLHAVAPFIAVWDDHEVTNDTWREGAENHSEGEGDFNTRKINALRAYFEWMPIRPVIGGNEEMIYRTFRFGDLVSLHMLDTRVIGRDEQLDLSNYFTGSGFNGAAFQADLTDANRTLLGAEQLAWLQNSLAQSATKWDVLGQQVLMGRMYLPSELLLSLGSGSPANLFAELATSSVTSSGFESYLQLSETEVPGAEQALSVLIDGLDYTNLNQRGFLLVTFRPDEVEADWRYVTTVKSETYSIDTERSTQRRSLPGASNRTLQPIT